MLQASPLRNIKKTVAAATCEAVPIVNKPSSSVDFSPPECVPEHLSSLY